MRLPGPHNKEADPVESLPRCRTKGHCSRFFFSCSVLKSFHVQKISHIVCWTPPVASHSTWYFCRHVATSGALKASHQRINVGISATSFSLVTFFGIKKKHRRTHLLRPFSTLLHIFQILRNRSPRFFGEIQWNLRVEAVASTPVFALYSFDTFSKSLSFNLGSASSNFFNSSFYQGLSTRFCSFSSHCWCFAHSSLLHHHGSATLHPLLLSSRSSLLLSML